MKEDFPVTVRSNTCLQSGAYDPKANEVILKRLDNSDPSVIKLGAKTACEFPNYLAPSFPRYLAAPSCAGLIPGGEWLGHHFGRGFGNHSRLRSKCAKYRGNIYLKYRGK
jgi:hypothetical protein